MARSVADVALLYEVMKGVDPVPPVGANERLRFGVPRRYFCDRLDPGTRDALDRAVDALRSAGHAVDDVEIEYAASTPDVYLHIVLPEASQFHAPALERFASSYCPGVRIRLEMGRYVLAEDYVRAMRLRVLLTAAVDRVLVGRDALVLPALPIAAPVLGASTVDLGGSPEPVRAAMLRLTQLFNLTGHPAIALRAAQTTDPLPRGIQLVGRRAATERLLEVAAGVERLLG